MARAAAELEWVLELAATGHTVVAIQARTGIPRSTIAHWLRGDRRVATRPVRCALCGGDHMDAASPSAEPYAYVLGLYLGDGHISHFPRTDRLTIYLDRRYPAVFGAAAGALRAVFPHNRVRCAPDQRGSAQRVQVYSTRLACLFPQHGSGMKHERRIELADWQRESTPSQPRALIRGLIHSDGCRYVNTVRVKGKAYTYPSYAFSNRSADIHGILREHLDLAGIGWREQPPWSTTITRRAEVAALDAFVGPKA